MATRSSITLRSTTDVGNVYSVAIRGQNMLTSNTRINFNNTILTTVTKHPHVVTQWIEGVKADGNSCHRHVGFEVEFDFSRDRIGTVQFYVGNRCLVFQLGDAQPCPPSLEQFVCDHDKITFVSTKVVWKMNLLRRQLSLRITRAGLKDLGHYETELNSKKALLLGSLAFPGVVQQLDWARASNLSYEQVHYACLDAFLNFHIANCLWNFN